MKEEEKPTNVDELAQPKAVRRAQRHSSEAGSIATGRKPWEKIVTAIWVVLTLSAFAWSMFGEGRLAEMSLEIGIVLLSMKIAWSLYQEARVNHYMFWILQTMDFKISDLSCDLRRQRRTIKQLEKTVADLRNELEGVTEPQIVGGGEE
ncbi:MAG: hypothetical protein GF403_11365 [Candidatus Coatesbacteria bacterium]|nr:hypothetical protein [Candidatus Coatesbacteria bacterium]